MTAAKRTAAVHAALGDPTREAIVRLLIEGELTVGGIADRLPVSRPAVSKHLRQLENVALVGVRREGTRSFYSVRPEGIAALRDELDRMWDRALARYALVANNTRKAPARRKE